MNNEINFVSPFKKFVITIGNLPTAYLESMSYYEAITFLVNYLSNNVIPALNNNGLVVEELQAKFTELKNYVDNYFENLDVQEEINNKLDEMADSGELVSIIAEYLSLAGVFAYDTLSDLKLAQNLGDGSIVKTLGYHNINDRGGAFYKVREITNDDVVDDVFIVELYDNNLIGELILNEEMNVKQLGIHEDDTIDDSDILQYAFDKANTLNFKIVGNYLPIIITKSVYIPYNVRVENLHIKTTSPDTNFLNKYMIGINTTNMSSWAQSYPFSTMGYMKHCKIENGDASHILNGIYNFANNEFEDMEFQKLDISFKTSANYLDTVRLKNFDIYEKVGTNYAIDLGYLGDSCSLDTLHMHDTIGSRNCMTVGGGHNPIYLSNLIPNGKININDSIVNINNIHSEYKDGETLLITNADVNIENGYITKPTSVAPIIVRTFSYIALKNLYIVYNSKLPYTTDVDVDIAVNSNLNIISSYKITSVEGSIETKWKSGLITSYDTIPTLKTERNYYGNKQNNKVTNMSDYNYNTPYVNNGATSSTNKWLETSGTYYYAFKLIVDNSRLIASPFNKTFSVSLTENSNGMVISDMQNGIWRVYRGTSSGSYDKYVDVAIFDNKLYDNGICASGYIWKDRTAADVDTFNGGFIDVVFNNTGTVVARKSSNGAPTVGSWKLGDMIFNSGTGDNGYICNADGTPGTWKTL